MVRLYIVLVILGCNLHAFSQENRSVNEVAGTYSKTYKSSKKELILYNNQKFKEVFKGTDVTAMIKKWNDVTKGKWELQADTIVLKYKRLFGEDIYKYIYKGTGLESHFCVTTGSTECKVFTKE